MHYGVVPDLVLCCEAKDLRTHLEPLLGFARVPVALDSFASEHNWNACERPCGFIRHEPSLIPYALQLGTLPVNYDGSVACAAVSLSILLGAEQVVLVGQDLAYTGGKCYADGTPFADLRASVIGDMLCVSGESKQVGPAPVVWRNGWREGEPVPSTRGMDDFVAWFAKAAKLYPVVNATEGGAHIPNTHEFALEDVLRQTRRRKRVVLPELEVQDSSAVRERMCELATSCLAGDAFTPPEGLSVLQLWCVPAILRAGEQGGSVRQMRAAMREAIEQGCREILEVLG
jgi:hypothetical protein